MLRISQLLRIVGGESCSRRISFVNDHVQVIVGQSCASSPLLGVPVRYHGNFKEWLIEWPKPGAGKQYRREIYYPDKYTIKPIPYRHLAGRDPVTGAFIN